MQFSSPLPLFASGPPFAHQRPPRKMAYYGDASCEHDTERYLDTLKYVFGGYERDVPLLINTMGWVKGRRGGGRVCQATLPPSHIYFIFF